jgi:SAM-dependent methyltransferase
LEEAVLGGHRSAPIAGLSGLVLDLGAGTGANLAHFRSAREVVAAEPGPRMRQRLAAKASSRSVPVEVRGDAAEALGFEDATFDTVVCTSVPCTVRDLPAALSEVRRVLRPDGLLAVLERLRADDGFAKWQRRREPIWSRLNPGCHPDRDFPGAIGHASFVFVSAETFDPMPSCVLPRPWLKAVAVPAAGDIRP